MLEHLEVEDVHAALLAEVQRLREENAELRQRDKVISRQLDRQASGADPLTRQLEARCADLEANIAAVVDEMRTWGDYSNDDQRFTVKGWADWLSHISRHTWVCDGCGLARPPAECVIVQSAALAGVVMCRECREGG